MTMHLMDMEAGDHPVAHQEAGIPALQIVTGFTCDECKSTDVKETGLHKSSFGQWIVTKCGNCGVTVMYKTE